MENVIIDVGKKQLEKVKHEKVIQLNLMKIKVLFEGITEIRTESRGSKVNLWIAIKAWAECWRSKDHSNKTKKDHQE